MRLIDLINLCAHKIMLKRLRSSYRAKLSTNRRLHPDVFREASAEARAEHIKLWSPIIGKVDVSWLDMFYGISGICDPRFVPEDVFYGVIERCLNNCNVSGAQLEDKSNCCFYMPEAWQPVVVVRYVRGVWFDREQHAITKDEARAILAAHTGDVVGKPAMGSCGGSDVVCFEREGTAYRHGALELTVDWIEVSFEAYVVQERLRQEPIVEAFNPNSLNTCRIVTFRRPWSGETTVIAGMLRLGCGQEIVDNLAAGGVSADIDNEGLIAPFAVDHDFGKVTEHPVSHRPFKDFKIPYYGKMCTACCQIAARVPDFNLLSFDVIARPNGEPCIIEINATSMTLAQVQTIRPLFGDDTQQVIDWCVAHRRYDRFNHLRTWY